MLCILCVTKSDQIIQIFDEVGISLDACSIISKYFWLKPSAEDPKDQIICRSCWNVLDSFHRFYQMVEEAHANLATTKTRMFNDDNASKSDNCCPFPEIPTEYDIKSEASDDTKVDLRSICTTDVADKRTALNLEENSAAFRNSECNSPPHAEVKTEYEDNGEPEMGNVVETTNHSMSDSESEIPLSRLSERKSSVPTAHKNIIKHPKSRAKSKDTERKGIPCQEFDAFIRQNMKLSCTICQKSFSRFFILKGHYKSTHNEDGYVICCEKKFENRVDLVQHIQLHQDPDYFKCGKCGKVLTNKKGLHKHVKLHNNNDRTHGCEKCKKRFFRKERLERHMKTHERREQICEHCGKVTRSLRQHLLREHSSIPKERVQCPKCGATLADKSSLYTHIKYVHPVNDASHVCNICGKISTSARGLERHILYMHKATRRHQCPMCEKAFKFAQILREHMTTHTGEVLYTCPHCPKTFNSNANMHSHRKKMHRKEWEENRRHPHMGSTASTE